MIIAAMLPRWLTFLVWLLVGASAVFWAARLWATGAPLAEQAQAPAPAIAVGGPWKRVLGAAASASQPAQAGAAAPAAQRYKLLGIVAPRGEQASPHGVALIAVGEEPARPYRTGTAVDGDLVLLSLSPRSARLGPRGGPAAMELTLPELAVAAGSGTAAPALPRGNPPPPGFTPPALPRPFTPLQADGVAPKPPAAVDEVALSKKVPSPSD